MPIRSAILFESAKQSLNLLKKIFLNSNASIFNFDL